MAGLRIIIQNLGIFNIKPEPNLLIKVCKAQVLSIPPGIFHCHIEKVSLQSLHFALESFKSINSFLNPCCSAFFRCWCPI